MVDTVVQLINTVGFPIACVCVMFVQMEKERSRHEEESKAFVEAIQNNTIALTKLTEKIEKEGEK